MKLRPTQPLTSYRPGYGGSSPGFYISPAYLHVLRLAGFATGRRCIGSGTKGNELVYLVKFLLPLTSFGVNIKVLS